MLTYTRARSEDPQGLKYPMSDQDKIKRITAACRTRGVEESRIQAFVVYAQQGRWERAYNILRKPTCAARRRRDGLPCLSMPQPPYKYCRFHGGVTKRGKMSPEGLERCREAGRRGGTKTQMQNRQRRYAEVFGE